VHAKGARSRAGDPDLEKTGAFERDESPYGVRDMSGGVSEWCETGTDSFKMVFGGSWATTDWHQMTAVSYVFMEPTGRSTNAGFRVVRHRP
jgi:formylglycine-generating enzyme required for sulfatase activity